MTDLVVDPFAGPGGWSTGIRRLGIHDIGIEVDPWACATRAAAGHRTIRADVRRMPLDHLTDRVWGAVMSPPCQAFSSAGKGEARAAIEQLRRCIGAGDWVGRGIPGATILEVGRWAETLRPAWVACEQVPPALPLWRAYAARWRAMGWSVWAGLLCAADFGVPQTRTRAFLLARTDGRPVGPPAPTHCRGGSESLFGSLAPWVSMAEALGWTGQDTPARTLCGERSPRWMYGDPDGTHGRTVVRTQNRQGNARERVDYERSIDEPAPTLVQNADRWTLRAGAQDNATVRPVDEPAPTVLGSWDNGDTVWLHTNRDQRPDGTRQTRPAPAPAPALTAKAGGQWTWGGDLGDPAAVRLSIEEALVLQSFPADYPVQGTKTARFRQVGDAVPPLLAEHVVRAVAG